MPKKKKRTYKKRSKTNKRKTSKKTSKVKKRKSRKVTIIRKVTQFFSLIFLTFRKPDLEKCLQKLEKLVDCKIDIISTGPDRDHTIIINNHFD